MNYITTDDGNTRLTLAQWQAQGHDLHSLAGLINNLVVDADNGNYLPKTNSPSVDAGQSLPGATTDLDRCPRPFGPGPDIGCYEQSPATLQFLPIGNDVFRLKVLGGAGRVYQVRTAAELTGWSTLNSFGRSNRPIELVVTNRDLQRFYRAVLTP